MLHDTITEAIASNDDRAVSPVIGVILMVAITVILAAVIGNFVLGIGANEGESPQASLSVSTDVADDLVTVEHEGGDGLSESSTRVVLERQSDGKQIAFDAGSGSAVFGVGDSVVIEANNATNATMKGALGYQQTADGTMEIESGQQYTVTIIDTDTQRKVYETRVTA